MEKASEEKKLIYAVDDEASIREVYKYALEGAGLRVQCVRNAEELFTMTEKEVPDLFILDIMLDGEDGYSILADLKAKKDTADIPVIMVSAKTTEIDKVRGLNLGADDYMSKPFGVLELIARINAKLRKATLPKTKEIKYKDLIVFIDKHKIECREKELTLTLKQYELLKTLIENAEKVIKRDELLDRVWGENYGETRTLDIHIGDLRKVLNASTTEIITVRGVGYMLK